MERRFLVLLLSVLVLAEWAAAGNLSPARPTTPPDPRRRSPAERAGGAEAVELAKRQATTSGSSIANTNAAGGITWLNPANTAAASYYKIAQGQSITFGWNYTSVLSFGTSITLQAYCSSNAITYSITSLPATATALTWEPWAQEQSAGATSFAQATYTMHVFDERGFNAGSSPGLMSPNSALQFAMYRPQSYTPLSSWQCASCSGATRFFEQNSPIMLASVATLAAAVAGGWYGVIAGIR